jgi:nicotinamide riboside kinase
MRISLTGATSTGKTTLARALAATKESTPWDGSILNVGARSILRTMRDTQIDRLNASELRWFQLEYLRRKLAMEKNRDSYLVERSFVDVAAYWLIRNHTGSDDPDTGRIVEQCRSASKRYSLHIYCPFGVVPFEADGYRSEDMNFHHNVDDKIRTLLEEWDIRFITLTESDLNMRVRRVLKEVSRLCR